MLNFPLVHLKWNTGRRQSHASGLADRAQELKHVSVPSLSEVLAVHQPGKEYGLMPNASQIYKSLDKIYLQQNTDYFLGKDLADK